MLLGLWFRGRQVWKGEKINSLLSSHKKSRKSLHFPKHLPFSSLLLLPQIKPRSKQLAKHQWEFTKMWKATKKSYLCSERKQQRKRQMSECVYSEVHYWKIYMVTITSKHKSSLFFISTFWMRPLEGGLEILTGCHYVNRDLTWIVDIFGEFSKLDIWVKSAITMDATQYQKHCRLASHWG